MDLTVFSIIVPAVILGSVKGCSCRDYNSACWSTPADKGVGKIVDCSGRLLNLNLSVVIHDVLPTDTVKLYLKRNDLDACQVMPRAFGRLTSLRELDLSSNRLRAIDLHQLLWFVPTLQVLKLGYNGMSSLVGDTQSNCMDNVQASSPTSTVVPTERDNVLSELYLQGNLLDEGRLSDLQGLNSLNTLDLSENMIEKINQSHLSDLSSLRKLVLRDNQINNASFPSLPRIESLNLHGNSLETLRPLDLPSLLHLDFTNNRIREIPSGTFDNLRHLISLELQGNDLGRMSLSDEVFSGLSQLYFLELSYNGIETLSQRTFRGLAKLGGLHLSHNLLAELPEGLFQSTGMLEVLSLRGNYLTTIDNQLHPLRNLQHLQLEGNRIEHIEEDAFEAMSSLRSLLLDRNQLRRVPAALNRPLFRRSLVNLSLSENYIHVIGENDFDQLRALKFLHLDNNLVKEIHPRTFHGLSAKVLTLNDNDLSHLREGVLTPLSVEGTQVSLYGNPWYCNCSLREVLDYHKRSAAEFRNLNGNVTCTSYEGTGTANLSISRWEERVSGWCGEASDPEEGGMTGLLAVIIVLAAALLIVVIVALTVIVVWRCRKRRKFRTKSDPPRTSPPPFTRALSEHTYEAANVGTKYLSIHEEGSSSLYYSQPYAHIDQQVILQVGSVEGANYVNANVKSP